MQKVKSEKRKVKCKNVESEKRNSEKSKCEMLVVEIFQLIILNS